MRLRIVSPPETLQSPGSSLVVGPSFYLFIILIIFFSQMLALGCENCCMW